ncbi:hypothetical protein HDU87_007721 [Geranomyces variabilis]|uniref:Vacuolar ATPase assembly protein VMA22 n=1 Tax=Geranomyces variabilis TaxID=109894 RepID=A0AAD5TDI0_9FUNG|nr:hypothetical protein HDU87_007721 [Geranomyces variabilis]
MLTTKPSRDDNLIALFDLVDSYLLHQKALAGAISQGSLSLAEAKYSLGPTSVSQIQYDSRMQRTRFVNVRDTSESRTGESVFEEVVEQPLTRRAADGAKISEGDDAKRTGAANPLAWFAPLPPRSLRNAQTSFVQAAKLAIRLAGVARELESARLRCADDDKAEAEGQERP